MEQPSNRLYSGTLSQAAQKVLAVLHAQSLRADRHPLSSPYDHRQCQSGHRCNHFYQGVVETSKTVKATVFSLVIICIVVERYNDNQRELLAHSSWRMSQEESSAREREW